MTDRTYEAESLHTAESRERDARFVGHEQKGSKMTDRVDRYDAYLGGSGQVMHEKVDDGEYVKFADYATLLAERDALLASQKYTYIGKDGKPILARDLEDQRDTLEAEAVVDARVIRELQAENQKLRTTLQGMRAAHTRAALAEQEKIDDQ